MWSIGGMIRDSLTGNNRSAILSTKRLAMDCREIETSIKVPNTYVTDTEK